MYSHGARTADRAVRRISIAAAWAMLAGTVVVTALPPTPASAAGPYVVNATFDAADVNPGNGICASTTGECTLRAALAEALLDSASTVSIGFTVSGPFTLATDLTAQVQPGRTVNLGSVPFPGWSTSGAGALRLVGFSVGNPNGGGPNSATCAPGQVVTGLIAYQPPGSLVPFGPTWLRAVQPVCRPITGSSGSFGLGTATTGPLFGTLTGAESPPSTTECAVGSAVTGFTGRSGALIDRLELYCAPLNPDGTLGASVPAGGSVGGTGGGEFAPIMCPNNTLANGVAGRTGDDIDQFGLTCGRRFTVDSSSDDADLTQGDGVCLTDAGECTLRAAIQESNASPGYDLIWFGIPNPSTEVLTLTPATRLPDIFDPVAIDGYTQTGAQPNTNAFPLPLNTVLKIELSGTLLPGSGSGLVLAPGATGSVIRGLIIRDFNDPGTSGVPNTDDIPGSAGIVLGTTATIAGNFIGTTASGNGSAPNYYGVLVGRGSDSGMIGGSSAASRNLISGNDNDGVYAYDFVSGASTNLTVQGNFIGTDAAGLLDLPNLSGVCPCSFGGNSIIKDNLLSGNNAAGVYMQGPDVSVLGNLIGVDATGLAALPNGRGGIVSGGSSRAVIGDGTTAGRNVISGNSDFFGTANEGAITGYFIGDGDSSIRGNYIGVDINGVNPIGNSRGIDIFTTATATPGIVRVGGDGLDEGNIIANSTLGDGVRLAGAAPVRIVGNSIYDNTGIGINIGSVANDAGDADTGANRLQNSPTITAASFDGQVVVNYTIDSAVDASTYPIQIDVYSADNALSGEGRTFVSRFTVDAPGSASTTLGSGSILGVTIGTPLVATATDAAGNTSQFSNVALIADGDANGTLGLDLDLSVADQSGTNFVVGAAGVPVKDFDRSATAIRDTSTISSSSITAIGLKDTSLAAITIGATPLRAIMVNSAPLRAISLVEVNVDGGWPVLLAGTELVNQPLSTLTLGEAFANDVVYARLASTPLRAIDVNGTPLSAIPLAAIALGATPLRAIALAPAGTNPNPWCDILADILAITGQSCDAALDENLMALSLRGAALSPAPLRAIPLRAIPLSATDPAAAPLRAILLGNTNLAASPLSAIPLRAITIANSPLSAIPLSAIPLRAIPLSAIPLSATGIAVNGAVSAVPTSITLDASPLRAIDAAGAPLSAIQVQGAKLAEVPLSAIVLADTPLRAIALDGVTPDAVRGYADAWCALLAGTGTGFDCSGGADPATTTLRDVSVNGVPLRAIPLRAINLASITLGASPLRAIPLSAIPLRAIPLRAIDLNSITLGTTPLRAIPLRAINVAGSPLSAIPLRAIDAVGAPLRAIPLSAIPLSAIPLRAIDLQQVLVPGSTLRAVPLRAINVQASPLRAIPLSAIPLVNVNCALVDCASGTLGDAFAKGAVPATTTLGDIQVATTGIRLGELAPYFTGFDVQQLIAAIALAGLTINDLLQVNGRPDLDDLTLGDIPFSSTVFDLAQLGDLGTYLADVTFADLVAALRDQAGVASLRQQINGLGLSLGDLDSLGNVTVGDLLDGSTNPGPGLTLSMLKPVLGFITVEALQRIVGPLNFCVDGSCVAGTLGDLTPQQLGHMTLQDLLGQSQFQGLTIGELLTQLIPKVVDQGDVIDGFTLGDLLLALIDPASLAQGSAPLQRVNVAALPPSAIAAKPFTAGFTLTAPTPQTVTLEIDLPDGAAYIRGSGVVQTTATGAIATALEPTVNGQTLSWTLRATPSIRNSVSFDMTPGLRLGPATIAATARIVGTDVIVPATSGVKVVEGLEPNDFAVVGGARQTTSAAQDNVYLTYVASPTDIDVFRIVVPEGGELVVGLSNLDADLDLALWGDPTSAAAGAALGPISADDPLTPVTDPDVSGADAQALNDFPRLDALDSSLQLISVSNLAGTKNESITTGRLRAGTYYVQVYGANGAISSNPAALQMKINNAEVPPECRVTTPAAVIGPSPTIPVIPAAANTLILVNQTRTQQLYGAASRTAVTDAITRLTTYLNANPQLGLNPVVVPVDGDPSVRAAYATWDSAPGACSPDAANTVVARINSIVNPTRAQFKHIVIVGGDQLIPMARLSDRTEVANEYDFRHEFDGDLAAPNASGRNAATSHLWESSILSDEPYGDAAARSLGDRYLYVTDVGLGRLVETPAEIVDALDTFVRFQGTLQISTAAVLGYDFLADGSAKVASELTSAALTRGVDADLADGYVGNAATGRAWDRVDAVAAISRARTNALISLNAHFDHYRALPAVGDQVPGFTDNLIAETVASGLGTGPDLSQSLVFSMGCHSGLSVSDILIGSTNQDWAQQLGKERALFVGNTGFGYGDTASVAYTEQLMTLFADQVTSPFDLDPSATVSSSTVGQALAWAKNQYVAGLQTFSVYDEKAVMESTFFGLPFYRVGLATQPAPATPTRQATPDATGTPASTAFVDALNRKVTAPNDGGFYYRNDGPDGATGAEQTIVAPGRPIQPKTVSDISVVSPTDPTALAKVAHGAMVLNMVSDYLLEPNPVIATPVFDESAGQPEPAIGDVAFPTKPLEITSSTGPSGQRQQLVLATGQYRSDNKVQRLDDNINVVVYYADPTESDFLPPTIGSVESQIVNGRLSLGVTAEDGGVVDRVFVLVAQNPGLGLAKAWTGVDLVRTPGTTRWTGSLALASGTNSVEFIVQAKDHAGNVGFATNKALNFEDNLQPPVQLPTPPANVLTATPTGPAITNGWFSGTVTVNVTTSTSYVYSVDGVAFPTNTPLSGAFQITGDGSHTWSVMTSDGAHEITGTVQIDGTGPTVTADPSAGARSVASVKLTAIDPGSGPVSVTYSAAGANTIAPTTVAGSTATLTLLIDGPTTITARATDFAGQTGAVFTFTYTLDRVAPIVTVTAPTTVGIADTVTITCVATDAPGSGIATTNCANQSFAASTLTPGANVRTFFATDVAGITTTVSKTITLVLNTPPVVLADMGIAGLNDIGFRSNVVVLTGSFSDPGGPGPFTASVQWAAGGPFTPLILNSNSQFIAANIYSSTAVRTVTVKICDASGACGTDDVTVRTSVTQKITPVLECVVNRGPTVTPRYLARWGYNNPAPFAIAVPTVAGVQNTFTATPYLRGQPQIFQPGLKQAVFTNTFASGTQTWRLDGKTAAAATNSRAC